MTDKITDGLAGQLTALLEAGATDDAMKGYKKRIYALIEEIDSDMLYRMKEELAPNLSAWVREMAERTITALLAGNEVEIRRYLGCNFGHYTGRMEGYVGYGRIKEPHEWHSVIHGRLFEGQYMEVRRKIVEAHRDLIGSERILDLEDQVKSLMAQVNKQKTEIEKLCEEASNDRPY